jgi:hypothetical protein
MRVFIPISEEDELDRCAASDRLVPYQPGFSLLSQCRLESTAADKGVNRYEAPAHRPDERPARPPCRR